MPAYNAQEWISPAIQSVLDQTWPRKELIIVDDGSRDRTLAVARRFQSSTVKVITQSNRGASAARNRALSEAQGDFIQWLDADDLLAPNKIELQLQRIDYERPLVVLSSAFGQFHVHPERAVFTPTPLWTDLAPAEWLKLKFAHNTWMNPAVWLVSRELTEAAGPWNESLSLDDDGEYFARIVARSEYVRFVPEARSYYRQWNAGSLSRTVSDKACRSLLTSLKLSIGYLRALDDSQSTRAAAVTYLSCWYDYLYMGNEALHEELQAFVKELGGAIQLPRETWKYVLLRQLLGSRVALRLRRQTARAKLSMSMAAASLSSHLDR